MYINFEVDKVIVERYKGNIDSTIFNSDNKYMYKDITNISSIKIVTGPTLYNGTSGDGKPQLKYVSPLLSTQISDNGEPSGTVIPSFIHFDIQ